MFEKRTAIILGAGASVEAGFPTGAKLIAEIDRLLGLYLAPNDITKDQDHMFMRAMSQLGVTHPDVILFRDGLNHCNSIDSFLATVPTNGTAQKLGKFCIAFCIWVAERNSHCFFNRYTGEYINAQKMKKSWYETILRLMKDGVTDQEIYKMFRNVTFINFNYDRSLAHYISREVPKAFCLSDKNASDYVEDIDVIHAYGSLGSLSPKKPDFLDYGADGPDFRSLSERIYAMGDDHSPIVKNHDEIRKVLRDCQRVFFLGFGFHKQNMSLLRPDPNLSSCDAVFMTTNGFTSQDAGAVIRIINSWSPNGSVRVEHTDKFCVDFFEEFKLRITY